MEDQQKEGEALLSKALNHFYFNTYFTQIGVNKVYSENFKTSDEMRMTGKSEENLRKFLVQIKPGERHKGRGVLIELDNDKITSAYMYSPGQDEVMKFDLGQMTTGEKSNMDIVVGGLSVLDLQMLQGVMPRERVSKAGTAEINSQSCYQLDINYPKGFEYDHVQFFATQQESLPVLLKVYDEKGTLLKEIWFDKYEPVSGKQVVKLLTIKDEVYGYTSTFEFKNTHIGDPIEDQVFTVENLKKGWGA
jgi:hypothetical protein